MIHNRVSWQTQKFLIYGKMTGIRNAFYSNGPKKSGPLRGKSPSSASTHVPESGQDRLPTTTIRSVEPTLANNGGNICTSHPCEVSWWPGSMF